MVKTSIRNNIVSIIRDPTTLLAILAAIILCFIDGLNFYVGPDGNYIDKELYLTNDAFQYMLSTLMGLVVKPIRKMLFPFIGIIIAINIFKDKYTNMYDLVATGQISFRQYYLSKIISYYFLSLALCLSITVALTCIYAILNVPPNANFEWSKVLFVQLIALLVSYSSCLFIPISIAVFLTAIIGNPIIGVIVNCVYNFIPNMIIGFSYTIWGQYIHVFPMTLYLYLKDWILYPTYERFSFEHRQLYGDVPYQFFTSFPDAIFSYILQILIATILFTLSYFLLKRRFKTS